MPKIKSVLLVEVFDIFHFGRSTANQTNEAGAAYTGMSIPKVNMTSKESQSYNQ
jgi:hypothetical protein